jgi:hypothetical protein
MKFLSKKFSTKKLPKNLDLGNLSKGIFVFLNNSAGHIFLLLKENYNQEKILIPVGTAIIIVK